MIYVDVKEWLAPYLTGKKWSDARWEIAFASGRFYLACFYDTGVTGANNWLYSWSYLDDHVDKLIEKIWTEIERMHQDYLGRPLE